MYTCIESGYSLDIKCSGPDGAGEPDVGGARLLVRHDRVRVLVVVEQNGLGGPAQQTVLLSGREKAIHWSWKRRSAKFSQ